MSTKLMRSIKYFSVFPLLFAIFCTSASSSIISIVEEEMSTANFVAKLEGAIAPGDIFELQRLIASRGNKYRRIIYLNSEGGDVKVGIRLGRFFREHKIRTIIAKGSVCKSACAIAFLGGTSESTEWHATFRTKSSLGVLGYHSISAFSSNNTFDRDQLTSIVQKSQEILLSLIEYFIEMDADPRLLKKILSTPPNEYYYIDNSDALDYCIHIRDENSGDTINPYNLSYAIGFRASRKWERSRCRPFKL